MSGSGERMRASEHELVDEQRRLAAAALRRVPDDADDVAEVDVDLAGARERAEQLDPAAAVDEVEEDELAHVAAREHAAGEAALPRAPRRRARALGLGAHGGDLVAVGEALAAAGSRLLDHSPGVRAALRRLAFADDLESVAAVEGEVHLVVRQQQARQAVAAGALEPGLRAARRRSPAAARPGRRRSRRGTSAGRRDARRAASRPRARRRGNAPVAAPSRIGVATSGAQRRRATRIAGRPGGSQRAAPRTSPVVAQRRPPSRRSPPGRARQELGAPLRSGSHPTIPGRVVLKCAREHRARLAGDARIAEAHDLHDARPSRPTRQVDGLRRP